MNWLDIVLAGLATAGFIKGWSDGFVRQVVTFAALIAAIYLCSNVAESLREYVLQVGWFPEQGVATASFVLAFLLISGLILLVGEVIHKMIGVTPVSLLNHLAGAVFGLGLTVIFLSLALNVLERVDYHSKLVSPETKVESRLYFHVKELAPAMYPDDLFIWRK